MENKNYNNDSHTNETENTSAAQNTETNSTDSAQTESSSTYSYSYLNQEQKNPNNIWRADENTSSAYTGGSASSDVNGSAGAYGSQQTGAGSGYGYSQTGTESGYGYSQTGAESGGYTQAGTESGYGYSQTGNSAYSSQQTGSAQDAGNAYGAYGGAQNGAYGNAQNAYGGQAYGSAQNGANGTYTNQNGSGQTGTEYNYSNIYGTSNGQARWNSYSDAQKQKKEERARKRAAAKAAGTHSNFGVKLAKCASIALVFGLVAGTAFEGSSYVAGNLFGTNNSQAETAPGEDKSVLQESDSTQNKAPLTNISSDAGDGVAAIVEACMPSIVSITNMSRIQIQNWFGQIQSYESPSAGSGVIVSEDDNYLYIATNNHVVASNASEYAVSSNTTLTIQFCDNETVAAEIKGTDASTDLAVVQVKKSELKSETLAAIKVASLGDSDKTKVGSQAIAIGNALGYGQSVTVGYISAVDREVTIQDETTKQSYTNSLIQTDAAINPGNSGGALLNSSGEVIGINSSKYSDTTVEGMGFAIPSNMAKPIIEDLITKEKVTEDKAAYLGISGADVTASVSKAYNMPEGIFVKEVIQGTAAAEYGIQQGDIITKFDGKDIKTMETLQKRLAYYEAGSKVEVVIQRQSESGYQELKLSVVLGKKNS